MKKHKKSWYLPGKQIIVKDKMQHYTYHLEHKIGTNIKQNGFDPYYTPQQMLAMGVFEGKYMNDCEQEFPKEWYDAAKRKNKLSDKPNPKVNKFEVKSRLSLQEWRRRGWIPVHEKDRDVRGWFQWYCRYYIGRRIPEVDLIQIKRWKAFVRHYAQVEKYAKGKLDKRKKQRQALLQWSWRCDV